MVLSFASTIFAAKNSLKINFQTIFIIKSRTLRVKPFKRKNIQKHVRLKQMDSNI